MEAESRREQARSYARIRRRLLLVDALLSLVLLLGLLLSGASRELSLALGQLTGSKPLIVAGYVGIIGLTYTGLTLPIAYYSGHVLQRRYGLSVQSSRQWLADWLKELPITGIFGLLVAELVYYLLAAQPDLWWLVAGGILLLFSVVLTHLAPILLMPIFYRLTPLEPGEMTERLAGLARRAGAEAKGVYRMNLSRRTTAANAALVGLGGTRRIVLGDTLLERFSPEEIEVVFAHELGHHVNRDIGSLTLVQGGLTLAGLFVVNLILDYGVSSFGFAGISDIAAFPLLALGLFGFGVVTTPIGNAFSRRLERAADRYALETSRNPEAFISAMKRLADQNVADYRPERWVEALLYTHPAPYRRVAMGEAYSRDRGDAR